MTYSKLLELIKEMSNEQKEMDVVVSASGEFITPTLMAEVAHNDFEDEESFPVGQPILS